MPLTKDERQRLDDTHDIVIEIKTVLLGANGDCGLCGDVKQLSSSHYRLRKYFWTLIGFLVGSGILAGGILSLR